MFTRNIDLAVAAAGALATVAVVLLVPALGPIRIVLGLPFILLLPGYVLVATLYPRKEDLDSVERTTLSIGLSIAIVPLIGLALNYSPWGIRLNPILAFVSLFIVMGAGAAMYRRQALAKAVSTSLGYSSLSRGRGALFDRVGRGGSLSGDIARQF
jgi:uncharacterized membrane protein